MDFDWSRVPRLVHLRGALDFLRHVSTLLGGPVLLAGGVGYQEKRGVLASCCRACDLACESLVASSCCCFLLCLACSLAGLLTYACELWLLACFFFVVIFSVKLAKQQEAQATRRRRRKASSQGKKQALSLALLVVKIKH